MKLFKKQKLLSLVLVFCMVFALVPFTSNTAHAANEKVVYVANHKVTSANYNDVTEDGTVSYDFATDTLTLNNADFSWEPYRHGDGVDPSADWGSLIFAENVPNLTIKLVGENKLDVQTWYNFYYDQAISVFNGDLTITGTGSLDISTEDDMHSYGAIYVKSNNFYMNSGTLNIHGSNYTSDFDLIPPCLRVEFGDIKLSGSAKLNLVGGTASEPESRGYAPNEALDVKFGTLYVSGSASLTAKGSDVGGSDGLASAAIIAENIVQTGGTIKASSGDAATKAEAITIYTQIHDDGKYTLTQGALEASGADPVITRFVDTSSAAYVKVLAGELEGNSVPVNSIVAYHQGTYMKMVALSKAPTNAHKVTYAHGGSGLGPAPLVVMKNDKFTVENYAGTKREYLFDGWTDGKNDYAPGDTYTVGDKDVTLTGKWKNDPRIFDVSATLSNLVVGGKIGDIVVTSNEPEKYDVHLVSIDTKVGFSSLPPETIIEKDINYLYGLGFTAKNGEAFGADEDMRATVNGETVKVNLIGSNVWGYITPKLSNTYTLSVTNGTGSGDYEEGEVVDITADTAPSGMKFKGWTTSNGGTLIDENFSSTSFVMPANAVTVTAIYEKEQAQPTTEFNDVNSSDWFYSYVNDAVTKGLFSGTSATTFSPYNNATRAMVWTVLGRMAGANVSGGDPWYQYAQHWAIHEGISDGTAADSFITREQFVTMVYRYEGSPVVDGMLNFADDDKVSSYAYEALVWAVDKKIISGKGGNNLDPQGNLTRAEMATILSRLTA